MVPNFCMCFFKWGGSFMLIISKTRNSVIQEQREVVETPLRIRNKVLLPGNAASCIVVLQSLATHWPTGSAGTLYSPESPGGMESPAPAR